jgi:hypothetical protein
LHFSASIAERASECSDERFAGSGELPYGPEATLVGLLSSLRRQTIIKRLFQPCVIDVINLEDDMPTNRLGLPIDFRTARYRINRQNGDRIPNAQDETV